tara:strand:+ start:1802 stop:2008 length:207 start_codon:yes stop_codon:yes gene_type:complete
MGKSNRTKGIENRGSQIHKNKKRHYYLYPKFDEWYEQLTKNEEEHDVPRRNPGNAIDFSSDRDALDNA